MILLLPILLLTSIGAYSAPKEPVSDFFRDKTKIDNPFELRDPFKTPIPSEDKNAKKGGYFMSGKGQYSNIQKKEVNKVEDIKVVGVLIGKERRAMVSTGDSKEVIILKEGMKIGEDGAELKAILPGGIILVEKMVNIYGQEEFLETVIPISK